MLSNFVVHFREKFNHLTGWKGTVDKVINEEVVGQLVPWQLFEWFDQFTSAVTNLLS